ncbi:hypothetical protein JCM3774_004411 [Rhodotorula dairenensis]
MLHKLLLAATLAISAAAAQSLEGIDPRYLVGFPGPDAPEGTPVIFYNSTEVYDGPGNDLERRDLVERASLTCPSGFSLNADKTACICRAGKVLSPDGSLCVARCVTGWYDLGNGSCVTCPEPFFACTDALTPTRCATPTFLHIKDCVTECPIGKWGDDAPGKNVCRWCADKNAQTCSDGGPDSATSCRIGYLFEGKCISAPDIPEGYYPNPDTKIVEKCDANVKTCTCAGPGCATSCSKTKEGDQYLLRPDGTCSLSCPNRTYADKPNGVCIACDPTALTCTSDGATCCGKDSAGNQLYLTPTRKCVLPWKGPTGHYPDRDTDTFKPCPNGVTSCVGPNPSDAVECGKRTDDVPLFFVPNAAKRSARTKRRLEEANTGTCVIAEKCPVGTWANPVDNTCTLCDDGESTCTNNGEGSALTCKPGFYLSETKECISATKCSASGPFFPDDVTGVCSRCDAGEAACTGNGIGQATECGTGDDGKQLFLYKGDCVSLGACPVGFYADTGKKQCLACGSGATACKGPHDATACGFTATGQRLYLTSDGRCVSKDSCPSGTWANPAKQACESCSKLDPDARTCTSPTEFTCSTKNFYKAACVQTCPSRFYASNDRVCLPCSDPSASKCDAGGSLSCKCGYLWNKQCLPKCPAATYAANGTCKACSDLYGVGTAICTSKTAVTCSPGYSLHGKKCVANAKCSGGSFPEKGLCVPCSSKYAYAATCDAKGPLTCTDNRWVDKNGKCAPNCVWEAQFVQEKYGKGWWRRPEYLDDRGFASKCRVCPQEGAKTCDRYTGKTLTCITKNGCGKC